MSFPIPTTGPKHRPGKTLTLLLKCPALWPEAQIWTRTWRNNLCRDAKNPEACIVKTGSLHRFEFLAQYYYQTLLALVLKLQEQEQTHPITHQFLHSCDARIKASKR